MLEITHQDVEKESQRLLSKVARWKPELDAADLEDQEFVEVETILAAILPVSRRTLNRKVAAGDFPAPAFKSDGRNFWSLRRIAVWRLELDFQKRATK